MPPKSSSKDESASPPPWVPDPESIVGTLIHRALMAMEDHGGRPEIRGVATDIKLDRFTVFACGNLTRDDFPDLPALANEMNAADPPIGAGVTRDRLRDHKDIRGIAFDLLIDTIDFKERLDDYRSEHSPEKLDAMLSSLHFASHTGGVLHNAYDARFESDLTKLRQQQGQNKGRMKTGQRISERDFEIVRVAQKSLHVNERAGRKRNVSALARSVIRHYKEKGKSDSVPGEKRIRAILREHLK
jgi:hypothetical protein